MTTKSPANAAHDAVRAEDARRARAELHAYIDSLERALGTERLEHRLTKSRAATLGNARAAINEHLASAERRLAEVTRERDAAEADCHTWRHRADVADHARATLNERLAAVEKQLAEVTRERDEARRIAEVERHRHEVTIVQLEESRRAARSASDSFSACARAAECVYEDGTPHDVRTVIAQIEQLVACANTRCTCAQLAAEDEAEAERDEARAAIHEAEERGMVRGLEHGLALLWSPEAESAREYAARICAEARAKGGEHG